MGRPKKERPKRVSGTGYTTSEASHLKYARQSKDGTWEIDTDAISERIEAYISDHTDSNGKIIPDMSPPGLREYLGVYSVSTFNLWRKGYVDAEHVANEGFIHNKALEQALARGMTRIGRAMLECESGKYMSRIRERTAESIGELLPQKVINEINAKVTAGKWDKMTD